MKPYYLLHLLDPIVSSIRVIGASKTRQVRLAELSILQVLVSVPIAMSIAIRIAITICHLLGYKRSGSILLPDSSCHSFERFHHILVRCSIALSVYVACHSVPTYQTIIIELIRLNIMLSVAVANCIHH